MRDWDIVIEGIADREITDDFTDAIVDTFAAYGPAVSYRGRDLSVRFTASAERMHDASQIARALADQLPEIEIYAMAVVDAAHADAADVWAAAS